MKLTQTKNEIIYTFRSYILNLIELVRSKAQTQQSIHGFSPLYNILIDYLYIQKFANTNL